jgi:DNA replication protein DnaC
VRAILRRGEVPLSLHGSVWAKVRDPLVAEWCRRVDERTRRRSDTGRSNLRVRGHGLMLVGGVGTGKSSAAALCCEEVAKLGKTVVWSYVPDLVDLLSQSSAKRLDTVTRQSYADLVVWDDFGVRDLADWEIGFLDQIVENRYRRLKPMVVTTNWTVADLRADTRLGRLVDRWGERTASQLVALKGASQRRR